MNIWIINHFAYGPDQSAGTRHYEFANALMEKGHRVLVIASSFYHKGRKEARLHPWELYRRESLYGIPFQWIRTPPYKNNPLSRLWNMGVFAWRVYHGRWRKAEDFPDIIIGSSPSLLAAFAGLLVARTLRVPFVLEIRDIWPDSLKDIGGVTGYNPVYLFFKFIEKYLYRKSDFIITLLPNSFEYITVHGGKQEKMAWIPNGVDLRKKPLLPKHKNDLPFTITYFGAQGPYNGLEKIVDAAAILKKRGWTENNVRFLLIGEGPAKDSLVSEVKRGGLDGLVQFQKAVPKQELWNKIEGADAFLMIVKPMKCFEKGMSPNKLWEYFSTGRPVIFSTVGGEDLASKSGAGIAVNPGDAASLADGVERLYAMSEREREQMGANGRSYAAENADIPQLVNKLQKILSQLVYQNNAKSREKSLFGD